MCQRSDGKMAINTEFDIPIWCWFQKDVKLQILQNVYGPKMRSKYDANVKTFLLVFFLNPQ